MNASDRILENGIQETVAQIPMVQSRTWLGWNTREVTYVQVHENARN